MKSAPAPPTADEPLAMPSALIIENYPSDLVADVKKYGAYDCPLLSYYLFYYARKEKLSYLCGEKKPPDPLKGRRPPDPLKGRNKRL